MSKAKQKTKVKTFQPNGFHIEWLNGAQELAWGLYGQHEVLFLIGPAGTAKTHLAMGFAIHDILNAKQTGRKRIILTRPVVEAGESLGYLPGGPDDKLGPYMLPLLDCLESMAPHGTPQRDIVNASISFAPLAYLRGRTFNHAVAILDEAQNATRQQLKMFLTRKGKDNCKLIITGDPEQSDLPHGKESLVDIVSRLETVPKTAIVRFGPESIVRDDWVREALAKLND